jgi:RNA polymerase sigma factor (TIGR02999 family)
MGGEAQMSDDRAAAPSKVTELLRAWRDGDQDALNKLTPIVYQDLRKLARRHLRTERADHTLQPTALINETYMRLVDYNRMQWEDRAHFLAVSAQLMRRILVDYARRRHGKRGGSVRHVPLESNFEIGFDPRLKDALALDEALQRLARMDPRKAEVVELRYFGGLSVEEAAEALGVSTPTVMRDWSSAKAWLYRELSGGVHSGS